MAAAYLARRLGLLVDLVRPPSRSGSLPVSEPREPPAQHCPSYLKLGAALALASCLLACQTEAARWPASGGSSLRQRWVSVVHPTQTEARPSSLVARIQQRIGARNSIRVHNAFRDLVWRLLSSLSMPTPVIYELRRQHLYSAEDDARNDALFNRNTTRSIRTRRLAPPDQDDSEPDRASFRARLENRLEQLLSLSRRTLVGRVIRLPALLPFKRHEPQPNQSVGIRSGPLASFRRNRRRRNNEELEPDRQKIFINGKQYYIDEDGELKELSSAAKV